MNTPTPHYATELLEQYWSGQPSLKRSLGAKPEEVAIFQTKYGVALPDDFAAYIVRVNGLAVPNDPASWENVDAEGFEFYPLNSICQALQFASYYVFCRWVLGLLPFAICLGPNGRHGAVVSLRGELGQPYLVASNFTSFVELYVNDSKQLYECGSRVAHQQDA